MKSTISKAVRLATLGLTAAGAMAVSQTTMAEVDVSASAGVASAYLFRGVDLGDGNAAVFGDITASSGGAYASIWASSGDGSSGSEYDLILGYGMEMGDFSVDAGVVNYVYPSNDDYDSIGQFTEVYVNLGFKMVGFSYYNNVSDQTKAHEIGAEGYEYYTLSGELGSFSALVGYSDSEEESGSKVDLDYTHIDLSYAYNDNLSFTASKIVDFDDDSTPNADIDDDLLFVVSYSLPIK